VRFGWPSSGHPRDDAVVVIGLVAGEFQSSYPGPDFADLAGLVRWLDAAGGTVEGSSQGVVESFEDRHIAIRYGPASGHR
jgi:hypothetical protein